MSDGGVFRGAREKGMDYFDDIMGDNTVPAIFDGDGFKNFDSMKTEPTPEGMAIKMHCRACHLEAELLLSWAELFIVAHAPRSGLLPSGWKRSEVNRSAYPEINCRCDTLLPVNIEPEWAAHQVDAAQRAGLLTPDMLRADPQVQALQQRMAQQQRG